ncbi:ethanolamine kinase 1 [Hippoglossus hippoglossus]|uniref:ethanolamine kinase 1 n=1 Tax=Hippoglossus hippoglossus TaxID=8267 RepID=UPI00148D98BE|nr:ethanolamine kinase 1 [Hippoglossus hippoglossus]XP_035011784.1 ethanolamine kinase 1 [Hippoglossus stenolepis]
MDAGAGKRLLHVDIHINELEPWRGILELLSRLRPHWKAQDIQMKTFTGGITNQLIGCHVGSFQEPGCVLVRLYGRMTELYVNRNKEVEMFQVFHAHGCGPQIYCSFQNGICYEFVRGTVLDDELLRQPSIYRLIAAEVGRIHSIQPKCGVSVEPLLWTKVSHFLTLVQSSINSSPAEQRCTKSSLARGEIPSLDTLSVEMESLKRHLSQIDSPTVLCHNDLLTKNIIYNKNEGMVKFIDYEYADYNYQAFDIGNHFNEFAGVNDVNYSLYPSRELQRDWLMAYLESYKQSTGREVTVTKAEVTQLYIHVCKFSLASNFFWGLWAILQSHFSSIDFDFQRYATARLTFYFEKKEEYFGLTAS